jgi:hypothetical protein
MSAFCSAPQSSQAFGVFSCKTFRVIGLSHSLKVSPLQFPELPEMVLGQKNNTGTHGFPVLSGVTSTR